jgi:hypothetical protein
MTSVLQALVEAFDGLLMLKGSRKERRRTMKGMKVKGSRKLILVIHS